jgi:hypothetical protein
MRSSSVWYKFPWLSLQSLQPDPTFHRIAAGDGGTGQSVALLRNTRQTVLFQQVK